jgi:hypothetical protein
VSRLPLAAESRKPFAAVAALASSAALGQQCGGKDKLKLPKNLALLRRDHAPQPASQSSGSLYCVKTYA